MMRRNMINGEVSSVFVIIMVLVILALLSAAVYYVSREEKEYKKELRTWQQNCKDKGGIPFRGSSDWICFSKSITIQLDDTN